MTLEIFPVPGLPEIGRGDDLAALITARVALTDGDVVLVAQKVVSKVEGALARPRPGEPVAHARRRLARAQARRIVADTPEVLITETRHGLICANGGIDASNAPDGMLILLPKDPDASARALRRHLRRATGTQLAVVITDTFGRPWRVGQTDVAIGLAGIAATRDERGGLDRSGAPLAVTEPAVADELAGAADLARRKSQGLPVVVVRGLDWSPDDKARASDLVRPPTQDLFRRGAGTLAEELATKARPGAGAPVSDAHAGLARRIAERAGARLATLEHTAGSRFAVDGDRLAAGLVVAALRDLGYLATWQDRDGHLTVHAAGQEPS